MDVCMMSLDLKRFLGVRVRTLLVFLLEPARSGGCLWLDSTEMSYEIRGERPL